MPSAINHEAIRPVSPEVMRQQVPLETLHDSAVSLNRWTEPIYEATEIGLPNKDYTVLAELQLGEIEDIGTIAVVLQKDQEGTNNFLLASLSKDQGKMHIDGAVLQLTHNQRVLLGRSSAENDTPESELFCRGLGLDRDTQISRQHTEISNDDGIITIHDTSMNGTRIRSHGRASQQDDHIAIHTEGAFNEAERRGHLAETAEGKRFDGRVPIGRDTIINGADAYVDIRSWIGGGEAIVVDSQKYPQQFEKLMTSYEQQLHVRGARAKHASEVIKLRALYETVRGAMQYDLAFVNGLSEKMSIKDSSGKRKVSLNTYLSEGKGVCRHMALSVAWLGGELARQGKLEGTTTAEVNQSLRDNAAHEWARYTAKDGTVYILDPAQQYFGTLADSLGQNHSWEYFRPGERMKYEALQQQKHLRGEGVAVSGISRFLRR